MEARRNLALSENMTVDGVIDFDEGWFSPPGADSGLDTSDLEDVLRERRPVLRHHRLARVDDLPVELDAGGVQDAAGRVRQLRPDAVAGDEGHAVGHAAIVSARPPEARPTSNFYAISPGYFATMQIPMLRGRDFTDADRGDQPRVTIVSRQLAMKIFNTLDVVGKRIRISQGPSRDYGEIVGVVDDVRQYGLEDSPTLQTYEPSPQHAYFGGLRLLIDGPRRGGR